MTDVTPSLRFLLNSDGSGNHLRAGGAACIVDFPSKLSELGIPRKLKFLGVLGACSGNEAELMAALMGFILISECLGFVRSEQAFGEGFANETAKDYFAFVDWRTDSQYLIRTSTQLKDQKYSSPHFWPAKLTNTAFWQELFSCWTSIQFKAQHVRAHSGDRRNEACDKASRWAQRSGFKLLERAEVSEVGQLHSSSFPIIGRLRNTTPEESWFLVDLRDLLLELRASDASTEEKRCLNLKSRVRRFLAEFSEN